MPAVGKTEVGRLLSERLAWPFVDLDAWIAAREGRSAAAIIETRGEAHFRAVEAAALVAALEPSPLVLACGGGTPLRAENRTVLRERGLVVWLQASPAVLWQRVTADAERVRPLLRGAGVAEVSRLAAARHAAYAATAHILVVNEGASPTAAVGRIAAELAVW